jgi:putative nucleotidyltransferase with HDIG domain
VLAQRTAPVRAFTRRDGVRLALGGVVLVAALAAILASNVVPQPVDVAVGGIAPVDIVAPRSLEITSDTLTEAARRQASDRVGPRYDYTPDDGAAIAVEQARALGLRTAAADAAFAADLTLDERALLLENAIDDLSPEATATLIALSPERWIAVRAQGARVLDMLLRAELRDSDVAPVRARLATQMAGDLSDAERALAAEVVGPLLVPNSSFSQELTDQAKLQAAAAVAPVTQTISEGQTIVRAGDRVDQVQFEAIEALGIDRASPDLTRLVGWVAMAVLLVAPLLAFFWRFRPTLWHRNNVLLLVGLLLALAAVGLQVTAGREILPYFLPIAAAGMLVAILVDAWAATVLMVVLAMLAGAVNGGSLELTMYVFLGGFAGILTIRRGDRLQVFVQAGLAVAVTNMLVVTAFTLLGEHDLTGILQLWAASIVSAAGAAIATVGSFAVLGNLFGILTVFQMLELANPSQPLLRRLLVETPGTYHHSLMVGNLAERAAEAVGADALLTRIAAYYHDIGKLSNPLAFIENQAGGENIHDTLEPLDSAQILKQHVPDGIDLAYRYRLPKTLIAFIPQHHGTTRIGYFYAKARDEAAVPYGGLETEAGRMAADEVDDRTFRHSGPKPQTREAAILMLADSVEASVRSLTSRDEPAIRAMVGRIFEERTADGQFEECDLTLRDIDRIREAFVQQLLGMYHQRIAYPQNKVVELESRRAAIGGGGPTGTGSSSGSSGA